jgi:hypothetical protein
MVKSLLLGGAAGLVAVAGAQAADLPMKAKAPAVQYVKICSMYGAGFYYIPGTDTCLKIGGYIRTQIESQSSGGGIITGTSASVQGLQTRDNSNDLQYRLRAVVTFDTRTQGEYGTLRSYFVGGIEATTPGATAAGTTGGVPYWDRAFIQFAGFTVGKARSFFDIYSYGGFASYLNVRTSGDNGASGLMMWAYTAQFGGGFSATLSFEDPRGHNLVGVGFIGGPGPAVGSTFGGIANGLANNLGGTGFQIPDIVANLRVDQPWGFAGISGALHQVAGSYWTANAPGCLAPPLNIGCGHPEDKWGYAFGIGAQLNVPGMPGDTLGAGFVWSQGAVGYAIAPGAGGMLLVNGNTISLATARDAVFTNPVGGLSGELHLTEAWSVNAHYQHAWTRSLQTSIYGGYAEIQYPGGAKALICGTCSGGRNPDYSFWLIGSRTQWSPWGGQLNIGVDVLYTSIQSAQLFASGTLVTFVPAAGVAQIGKVQGDTDNLSVMFRVQRNWFP